MSEATFACITYEKQEYSVLVRLSPGYSKHKDRLSTRYSPVRHSTQDRSPFRVRLACVKHAASVRSEPGSNSPVYYPSQSQFDWTISNSKTKFTTWPALLLFSFQRSIHNLLVMVRSNRCCLFNSTRFLGSRQQLNACWLSAAFATPMFFTGKTRYLLDAAWRVNKKE